MSTTAPCKHPCPLSLSQTVGTVRKDLKQLASLATINRQASHDSTIFVLRKCKSGSELLCKFNST